MAADPKSASPVISPRTSTLAEVFSGVKTATSDRLRHTMPSLAAHNRVPNLIAQSRATLPQAHVSNEWVAEARSFQPLPGRQTARQTALNVRNDPGFQVDQVADAIQRYLGVRPRREPTADPRDEGAVARHPQGLLQSGQRWADDQFYQFTANGAASQQIRPDYRAWGGRLELELENQGPATVSAPPSNSPRPGAQAALSYYHPAFAAQEAMGRIREELTPRADPAVYVGPPSLTGDPYFNPASAWRNAMLHTQNDLAPGPSPNLEADFLETSLAGDGFRRPPADLSAYPADAARAAVSQMRELMAPAPQAAPSTYIGPPSLTGDPYFNPALTWRNAMINLQNDLAPGPSPNLAADFLKAGLIRDSFHRAPPAISDWT